MGLRAEASFASAPRSESKLLRKIVLTATDILHVLDSGDERDQTSNHHVGYWDERIGPAIFSIKEWAKELMEQVERGIHTNPGRGFDGSKRGMYSSGTHKVAEFLDFLEGTLIPDLKESGHVATAEDFEKCVGIIRNLMLHHRPNPAMAIIGGNRGRVFGKQVHKVFYEHVTEGNRVHEFEKNGTKMEALPDGSIRIYNPKHRLWEEDA